MGSTVLPDLPAIFLSDIKETLAIGFVGVILASWSILFPTLTILRSILDAVSLILAVETLYTYVVVDFGDPLKLLNMPPALAVENAATVLIGTLVQCFLAHRLWELSKHNAVLVCSVIILAFGSFGPGIVLSVKLYTHRLDIILQASSVEGRTLGGIANGMSAVCDVVITASLCYYLHSKRTGFKRTNSIIDRLIIYAVNRGALTAICQTGEMIGTIVRPDRYIYLPFALLSGKCRFTFIRFPGVSFD
ncbi:hypothetical protein GSI_02855 [Ganoderma sinense ZZ0214-1]|uniref:DUF6534 domain-containing protein n=1 Tax=Ganoderma sinense ZZ0214-1 TaxID=1077348 RepID=A0A2G8SMR7_9APHY|nr:hypothetical protein GSI_02855 [Ganoderma sinense ZZ0214-1]